MSMIMNYDMASLASQRSMNKHSLAMRKSLHKLSSGLRTKAAELDNSAEVAVVEVIRSQISGMEKALNNSQDGVSLIQTATGGLTQTQSMLSRMRELSVQAANDSLTQQDRSYIQVEINELRDQIDMVGNTTQFNRKTLLNGDNAILWSSTDSNVKAVVNGGLRSIDEYGQKYSVDGNFKLSVMTRAGKAQTQKSNVFHVKHDNAASAKIINSSIGAKNIEVKGDIPPGHYDFSLSSSDGQAPKITGSYGIGGTDEYGDTYTVNDVFDVQASEGLADNASILFEVKSVNKDDGTVHLRATANILSQDGVASQAAIDDIMLTEEQNEVNLSKIFGNDSLSISLNSENIDYVQKGGAFVVNVSAQTPAEGSVGVDIEGIIDSSYADKWAGAPFGGETLHYAINAESTAGKEIKFTNFILNEKNGTISEGNLYLKTGAEFQNVADENEGTLIASITSSLKGNTATGQTQLRDIDKFWDAQGKFLLSEPKELTLTQGDGKQAKITIYADDTLNSVAKKLNDAVATGLGQSKYVDDDTKFVTFVEGATLGAEAAEGTIVMRSALAGRRGEITMSGNEELLNAFGLNEIQKSEENSYSVTVKNAHDDSVIAENVKVTGSRLVGVIHKNVDVEFDPMLGIATKWNESSKNFEHIDSLSGKISEITLHLADNTTVIQNGADEGEDVLINIGDMRSSALGLDGVNVMSQASATQSISIIDAATDKISMQMAKLGASQNRLEHHIGNLTDRIQALIDADKTIRDTDYAKEMLNFTKIRILMESNSAMLAQANTIQTSSILNLMR